MSAFAVPKIVNIPACSALSAADYDPNRAALFDPRDSDYYKVRQQLRRKHSMADSLDIQHNNDTMSATRCLPPDYLMAIHADRRNSCRQPSEALCSAPCALCALSRCRFG